MIYASNDTYVKLLKNIIRFSKEFEEIEILFLSRMKDRYKGYHDIINVYFNDIYKELFESNINIQYKENNYPMIKNAKLAISTVQH